MARPRIELRPEEAAELRRRVRASTVSVRERRRSEIILLSAEGLTQQQIAERMGLSRLSVNRWVGRFAGNRLAGLTDAAGMRGHHTVCTKRNAKVGSGEQSRKISPQIALGQSFLFL